MIVVDTNVVLYFYLQGPRTRAAAALQIRDPEWAAPPLWRSELWNVLSLSVRLGRMPREKAVEVALAGESVVCVLPVEFERVLDLVARSGCTAYDCEFVALAKELDVPLVTTDKQVLAAFPETAVSLEAF